MAKIQVSVTVEQSAYDMGKQLGALVNALIAKKPLAEIAAMELTQLAAIAQDVNSFGADLADDKVDFIEGAVLGLKDGYLPPAAV